MLKVLRNLLAEHVPVRDMRTIAGALAQTAGKSKDPDQLTAAARLALGSRRLTRQRHLWSKRQHFMEIGVWVVSEVGSFSECLVFPRRVVLRSRMTTASDFEDAQARVKTLPKTPNPGELLELYALFKQATQGDVTGPRPGMLDIKGRAKFDAWDKKKGLSAEAAQAAYVRLVAELEGRYR